MAETTHTERLVDMAGTVFCLVPVTNKNEKLTSQRPGKTTCTAPDLKQAHHSRVQE